MIASQTIHGAVAAHYLDGDEKLIGHIKRDFLSAPISDKLKALLVIAGKVQQSGKNVTSQDIANARARVPRISRFTTPLSSLPTSA